MIIIAGLVLVVFVLPNTINFKERDAFSDAQRLEWAAKNYNISSVPDSVFIAPGPWYDRGGAHPLFFGEKYREIWNTPVKMRVLRYEDIKGGLEPESIGGGQQTFSVDMKDSLGREWAVRSINKDQSKALPKLLRGTVFRFMFRDQAASMNPYGALVLPPLAEAAGIYHTNPVLVFVPFDSTKGEYNEVLAGRVALLESDIDGSWEGYPLFDKAIQIKDTEEMLEMTAEENLPLDTLLYARSRLFDVLISDWDRHEGQWEWALVEDEGQKIFKPLPSDRDGAFYRFNEGLFPKISLLFSNKFQSFQKDYKNIKGLTVQAREMDQKFLATVSLPEMLEIAEDIKAELTDEIIHEAFLRYPPEIYEKMGEEHEEILKARRDKLPEAARRFWEITNKNKKKSR